MTGNQLRGYLISQNFALVDLAGILCITPQALNSKLNSKDVTLSFLKSVADAINKNVYQLINLVEASTIVEASAREGLTLSEISRYVKKTTSDNSLGIQGVPYYNIPATAGLVSLFSQQNGYIPESHITIPNMPKCDGAIPIVGDSMYPLIKSGDTVLYKLLNDKASILWGGMYVVMIVHNGDEIFFVKYVQKSEKEGYVRFVSYNDHHQPVEFPMDSIMAIAEVKATIRINSAI